MNFFTGFIDELNKLAAEQDSSLLKDILGLGVLSGASYLGYKKLKGLKLKSKSIYPKTSSTTKVRPGDPGRLSMLSNTGVKT